MSWIVGNQKTKEVINFNDEIRELKGELSDDRARITFAKFLRQNLAFSADLLLDINLEIYQEIILRAFFRRNFNMLVWGRGSGKTFEAAVFSILACIFNPDTRILIASANFRTSRRVFTEIEKLLDRNGAGLAAQCFGRSAKRSDEWVLPVKESKGSITAIPLSGEKVRGYRANVLIIDEFLLMPKQIVDTVLMPFLSSPLDVEERGRVRSIEDELIEAGEMREEDRVQFENTSKMISLSSASYTFEYLYELYRLWCDLIDNPNLLDNSEVKLEEGQVELYKNSTYFVSQLAYDAIPEHMMDNAAIQQAKSGGISLDAFAREYEARFIDGGDGYFSPKRMNEATIPDGEYPTTKVVGDPNKKYVLAIDPNLSSSDTADYFAMAVLELDDELNHAYYVHGYQRAGVTIQEHIKYFYYLLAFFKPEMIILDNAGGDQFIEAANGSALFKTNKKEIKFFELDSEKDGEDYQEALREARKQYNKDLGVTAITRVFTSNWIRRSNEFLQSSIQHKRLWFASRSCAHDDVFEYSYSLKLPMEYIYSKGYSEKLTREDDKVDWDETNKLSIRDFIEWQDHIIKDTKDQCALIKVTSTAKGTQTFDLPLHLRRLQSKTKPRKDNYSALLLGNWGVKCYRDMMGAPTTPEDGGFVPFILE